MPCTVSWQLVSNVVIADDDGDSTSIRSLSVPLNGLLVDDEPSRDWFGSSSSSLTRYIERRFVFCRCPAVACGDRGSPPFIVVELCSEFESVSMNQFKP